MLFRFRDIVLALIVLILFSWLFLLIVLLLALSQKRVFFTQERTGFQEKPFKLIKFSTLRDIRPGEREEDDQKARLTPVGRILRRLSLDEMPQLLNVLSGKMSLVGPRPLLHEYLPLYSEEEKKRFLLKPGITGWAQVNGRNRIPFKARFQLDLWYLQHRSFRLDRKIIWLSVTAVFSGKDVYTDSETTSARFNGSN